LPHSTSADLFQAEKFPTTTAANGLWGNLDAADHVSVLKSLQRLAIDPLAVYGTNCFKFGTESATDARAWLTRELHIVQPKLVVLMGARSVAFLDELCFPLSDPVPPDEGTLQRFTPTIEALVTPDVDESLDDQAAKTRFWNAFKALGPWWAEQPPY